MPRPYKSMPATSNEHRRLLGGAEVAGFPFQPEKSQ